MEADWKSYAMPWKVLTSITHKLFLSLIKTENFFASFQLRRRRKTDLPPLFKQRKDLALNKNKVLLEKRRLPILPAVNRKYFRRKRA